MQIIEWFEQFSNGVAQTHTELGESQEVAKTLAKEVTDFETATKVQIHNIVIIGPQLEHHHLIVNTSIGG